MIEGWLLGIFALMALLVGAVYLLSPRAAVGGLFFGVTVAPSFAGSDAGRAVSARYRTAVIAWTVVSLAVMAAGYGLGVSLLGGAALILQAAVCTMTWIAAHRATLPHALASRTSIRRATLAPVGSALSPLLDLLGYALLVGAGLLLLSRWEQIPERFITHWGTHGPDGWGSRTPRDVFGPLVLGAVTTTLFVAMRWIIHLTMPDGATPRAWATKRLTGLALVGASWMVAAIVATAALVPLTGGPGLVLAVVGLGLTSFTVALVIGLVHLTRLPPDPPGSTTPDAAWRGGVFYVNPDDPAIWVPKRMGLGYTVNLAHRGGKLVLAALVVLPLVIAAAAFLLSR